MNKFLMFLMLVLVSCASEREGHTQVVETGTAEQAVTILPNNYGVNGSNQWRCTHNPKDYSTCFIPKNRQIEFYTKYADPVLDVEVYAAIDWLQALMPNWQFNDHNFDSSVVDTRIRVANLPAGIPARTTVNSSIGCTPGICKFNSTDTYIDRTQINNLCTGCGWSRQTQQCKDLYVTIVAHEMLHAAGLGHSQELANDIMFPSRTQAQWCQPFGYFGMPTQTELDMLNTYNP